MTVEETCYQIQLTIQEYALKGAMEMDLLRCSCLA